MCPIKNAKGEIDPEALADLVQVGGHYIEAGVNNFTDWSKVMSEKLGDVFNQGDLATIYANSKTEIAERTGREQTYTNRDTFIEAAAKKYGWRRAAEISNALVGPDGDTTILDKLMHKQALSKTEAAQALKALNDTKQFPEPPKPNEQLAAFEKAIADARAEVEAAKKAAKPGSEPAPGRSSRPIPKGKGEEGLREQRSEWYRVGRGGRPGEAELGVSEEPDLPPTDEDVLDKHMSAALGNGDRAQTFRSAAGEDLYAKMATREALTPAEHDVAVRAFADAAKPRTISTPSDLAKEMAPITSEGHRLKAMHDAEGKTADFEAAKEWHKEILTKEMPDREARITADLDKIKSGDFRGLTHVYNQHRPGNFLEHAVDTHKLGMQGAMLSSPGSLAVALYNHLASVGIEQTVARGLAHIFSGGLHPGVDLGLLAKSIKRSYDALVKPDGKVDGGVLAQIKHRLLSPEVSTIFHSGEGTLTAQGRNSLHVAGESPRREFTVGRGGPIGNMASAIMRGGARMHGGLWHMVGAGVDEIALQDAARFHAIDEARAGGKKLTGDELKVRTSELRESMPPNVRETATKMRQEQLFQNKNQAAEGAKKLLAAAGPFAPLFRPLIPFADVAMNLGGRSIEHMVLPTPHGPVPVGAVLSILKRSYEAMRGGVKFADLPSADKAALAKIAARGIIGMAIYEAGKHIHGVHPPNPQHGEYGSVDYKGNKWEVGRLFGAYGGPFFQGSYDAQAEKDGKPTGLGAFMSWVRSGVNSVPDNMFSNAGEARDDIMDPNNDAGGKATKAVGNIITGHVPAILRNEAAWRDPTHGTRVKAGILDATKNSIDGLRETLPSSQDFTNPGHPYPEAGTIWPEPRHVPTPGAAQQAIQDALNNREKFLTDRTAFYQQHGFSRDGANAKARQDMAIIAHKHGGGLNLRTLLPSLRMKL